MACSVGRDFDANGKITEEPAAPLPSKIDVDFGGRVEVYTKQELLNGQNFNPTAVTEQLSVMVLSYDSFRGRGKEVLKAYQENSNLAEFAKVLGKPDSPIEKRMKPHCSRSSTSLTRLSSWTRATMPGRN